VPEEGREVRFRVVAASADQLSACGMQEKWLVLAFSEPRPFTADEARRVSPAAPFQTTALGVVAQGSFDLIWGVVQTGAEWLTPSWGGRPVGLESQRFPLVQVLAPGRLAVYCGNQLIAALERGFIEATTTDVFTSRWLPRLFERARRETQQEAQVGMASQASFDESLIGTVSQHMIRRAIFLIRSARHGGLLLFMESSTGAACARGKGPVKLKYALSNASDRGRYRVLLKRL